MENKGVPAGRSRDELLQYCPPDLVDSLLDGVIQQVQRTVGNHGLFGVHQRNNHTFPDGETYYRPYFLFKAHGVALGVAHMAHGAIRQLFNRDDPGVPCLRIDLVQGEKYVDAREHGIPGSIRRHMLEHLIASAEPLLDRGWIVSLSDRKENKSLIQPYFPEPVPGVVQFHSYADIFPPSRAPFQLDLNHRKVRRLFAASDSNPL